MKTLSEPISQSPVTIKSRLPASGHNDTGALPTNRISTRGWILYDGECSFCVATARRFEELFNSRGFVSLPLQTPWVQRRLDLVPGAPLEEMRVLTMNGDIYGGADAVLFLARQIWFLRPLAALGRIPPLHSLVDAAYRWIAAHRSCDHSACSVIRSGDPKERRSPDRRVRNLSAAGKPPLKFPPIQSGFPAAESTAGRRSAAYAHRLRRAKGDRRSLTTAAAGWGALILLPTSALIVRTSVEPWVFMWLMVGSIFLGCKWLTLSRAQKRGARPTVTRQFSYLFLSGGMDADRFLGRAGPKKSLIRAAPQIAAAIGKIALGALLLFGIARHTSTELVAGWIGMIGMILMVHFGVFDLTATWWQTRGIATKPIMNAPWKSAGLSEFWGRRWNHAFQQLVINTLFRPLAGSLGSVRATLLTFFVSGLLHELVISLPAGAGYGLPTAYFLLQGWGLIAQRTPIAGRLWFDNRLFTQFLLIVPAFALFHPPFIRRVIIPFMQAIGAL